MFTSASLPVTWPGLHLSHRRSGQTRSPREATQDDLVYVGGARNAWIPGLDSREVRWQFRGLGESGPDVGARDCQQLPCHCRRQAVSG
jgi:hypothetical protein